ncbi:MAG TPA: MEDS domain-containing protein [Planctomycetota bacterium]|nr:MEDS domain-containing protein [Planctomycetota bacterium]
MNPLLAQPEPADHLVQFYGDEACLAQNVSLYLREGAERGDGMILIATSAHADLFARHLRAAGTDPDELSRAGRLVVLDAERTLSQFLVDGLPDWERFDSVVGGVVRSARRRAGSAGIRAYGEMVDLLWRAGRLAAATRLEEFWNRLLARDRFGLFCAYTVDLLGDDVRAETLGEMLRNHTHLLPVRTNGELDHAVGRALADVLGAERSAALMPLIRATRYPRTQIPDAEAAVLWLKNHVPPYADAVLARARAYYESECARTGGSPEGSP